jgi:hypothetical protein
MPLLPCPETEDGFHVPLAESVRASHTANIADSVVVTVICAACGARGDAVPSMAHLVWTPPPRRLEPDDN